MQTDIVRRPPDAASDLSGNQDQALTAVSQTREAISLRMLLELRRCLKGAAERELAVDANRMRGLREELRRAEAELRLTARALSTRSNHLAAAAARIQKAQSRAAQAGARLSSLEQEHQDLAQQLADAHQAAEALQDSVRVSHPHRNGTLDSLLLASRGLINDLEHAARDEASLRQRGHDLIDETQGFAARCGELHTCFTAAGNAMSAICSDLEAGLDSLPSAVQAPPQNRPAAPSAAT
jgi:chromosome segregation ATPase